MMYYIRFGTISNLDSDRAVGDDGTFYFFLETAFSSHRKFYINYNNIYILFSTYLLLFAIRFERISTFPATFLPRMGVKSSKS